MSRDDIIRMAREAGMVTGTRDYASGTGCMPFVRPVVADNFLPELERFAALVAAHEREQCAKVCEDLSLSRNTDWEAGTLDCAAAIRARGQT